jgi:alcohol dehydrogenase
MKATYSPISTASGPCNLPPFDFLPLGRVIFEAGGLSRLGECVRTLPASKALLVTDPGLERSGHPQRAQAILESANVSVTVFDDVIENPTEKEVAAGVSVAKRAGIDAIVAIGGGSTMDCAKGINFILTNGGRMADYKGHDKATKPMLPSVGVPTTAGTGSEAQSYALISDPETHLKMACGDKKAAFRVSILDPELTVTQPRAVTAATGIDAIAHAIESYVCTKANPISRMASFAAFRHLEANFERVLAKPNDLDARASMQIGSHFAGMAIENAMLGVCHSCANPLTANFGTVHGIAIGIMLPHVIRFNAKSVESDYRILCGQSASWLADRVQELVRAAGMPTKLREVEVNRDAFSAMADEANRQWTARFNPRAVTEREIHELYDAAW